MPRIAVSISCYLVAHAKHPYLKIYFISGIGADYRLFTHLRLPEGYEAAYIHWIPTEVHESLEDYAVRLAEQIDRTEPFVLAGLSLGGMMAVEIAKRFPPVCTILISSIPVKAHLPGYFLLAHRLRLNQLIPASFLKRATAFKQSLTIRSKVNRRLVLDVIRSGDNAFIHWGMKAVLEWTNATIPHPFYHIHGSRDEIFPLRLTRPTHIVPRGGHMFLMNQPEAINSFLREILPASPLPNSLTSPSVHTKADTR